MPQAHSHAHVVRRSLRAAAAATPLAGMVVMTTATAAVAIPLEIEGTQSRHSGLRATALMGTTTQEMEVEDNQNHVATALRKR